MWRYMEEAEALLKFRRDLALLDTWTTWSEELMGRWRFSDRPRKIDASLSLGEALSQHTEDKAQHQSEYTDVAAAENRAWVAFHDALETYLMANYPNDLQHTAR